MKEQRTFGISKRLLAVFILLTMLLGMMIPALSVRSEAADDTYRITLRLNSGKFVNEGTSEYCTQGGVSQNRIYDIPYGVSIYDAIPWEEQIILRNGYVFTGWVYTNSSGSIPSNGWQPSLEGKKPMDIYYTYFRNNTGSCGNVYFTAIWIAKEYTMGFDAKMGTITKGSETYDVAYDISGGGDQGVEYYNAMLHDLEAGDVPHAEAEGFTFVSWTLTDYYWSLKPSDELGRPWADGNHYGGTVSETWALTKSATFDGYWECNADNFEDVYIAPTCLTDGFDGQVCLTCQANSEYKDFINNYHEPDGTVLTALGHDMGEWIDQKDGTSRSDCERDGCDYFETRNNTYDIEYYDEGGAAFSGTHGANAPTAHTFGTQTKLVNAANKTGMYTFGGWYSDPECTTAITTIEATDFKSSLDESYKIYAKWIPVDYTITYYHGSTNITTKTAYFPDGLPATGHSYGTDTVLIDAYKRGWTFEGWYTNSSFTTPAEGALSVLDGEGYTANIKLYAKFTEDYYPITYLDKNGEPYSGDTVIADAKLSYTYDDGITFPTVTKTGYTFGGWFADEDCSGTKITKFGAATTDGPQTLYALWTPNSYTITYYYLPAATGGSANAFDTAAEKGWLSENYATTHTYDQITELPTVTRTGWTWGGKWFTNSACTTPAQGLNELAGDGYTAAIKLYTRIVVNTYNIEYYDEGGAMYSGENLGSLPATFVYDTAKTLVNGTKTGYTFGGWFTDPECTNKVTALAKNTYAHDVKLYAKWTPNSYAITYLNFNTTSGSINTASYFPNGLAPSTHTYDQDTIIPVPVRTDYYFLGWYTSKAATAGTEVPMIDGQYTIDGKAYTAKFTVYAKWEKVSAHVCTPGEAVIEHYTAPTCTVSGSYDEVTYCTLSQCGKECTRTPVTVPALGHDYIDHEAKQVSCLEKGWDAYQTCSRCDYTSYSEIPATGHNMGDWYEVSAPGCLTKGLERSDCQNTACGCTYYETRETDALDHSYKASLTPPTCTEAGYTTYVCERCGDTYTDDSTAALDHLWGEWYTVEEATYFADGLERRDCQRGDATEERAIPMLKDNTPPAVTVTTDPEFDVTDGETDYSNTDVEITIEAFDNETGIDEIYYIITDEDTKVVEEGIYDPESKPVLSEEGEYTVTAKAVDNAGNETEVVTDTIVIDKTAPVIGGIVDGEIYCGEEEISFTVDEKYIDKVYVNGEEVSEYVLEGTPEGTEYTVTVTDKAGNSTEVTVTVYSEHNYAGTVTESPSCTEDGEMTYVCANCGDSYTEAIESLGHIEVTDAAAAPKCEETGLTEGKHCERCGTVLVAQEVVDAHGHNYVVTDHKDESCTEDGYDVYTCTHDASHTYTDVIPAHGHSYELTDVVPPTCTENGYSVYTCPDCGDSYHADPVDAEGHQYELTVTDPTCTEGGHTTYVCGVCKDTYVSDYTDALGHEEKVIPAVAPDCTEDGSTEGKYCNRCGELLIAPEVDPAHGHNYVVTDHKDESCTEDGYDVYTCTHDASHTYTVTYTKLGHIEVTDEAAAPKCEETGLTEGKHCERCGTVLVAQEVVDAHGHNYVVTDHKDASCTEDGYDVYTCTHDASHTYTVTYTKLGHIEVTDAAVAPKCEETGLTEGKHCERCGTVLVAQEIVDATGHAYDNGVVTTEPTCTADGIKTFTCANDASHTYTEAVSKLGHKALEAVQENYAAPKCFVEGSYDMAVYCERCGTELSRETVTVPALEHKYAFASDKLVKCANCGDLYNGFFENTDTTYCEAGMYYCIEGVPQKDLFVVDGYYYYGHSDKNGRLAENEVVLITTPAKNAFNAENPEYFLNGVFSCYEFLDDCKMKKDGYVTGVDIYGLTKTWLYEDYQLVMGLRRFESEDGQLYYRFFNRAQGYMYTDHSLWITEINDVEANAYQGDYGLPHGWYEIGSDGNIILPEGLFIIYQNGKYYLTENGWKQPQGLYELEEGVYVYVKTGLTLAVDEVIWLTDEYKNGLIPAPDCFYYFGEDFVMETDCFVTWLGKSYYINADATVALGFTNIGDDYYYFNNKSGIMYKDTTLWVGVNDYGFTPNNYYFMEDGKMYVPSVTGIKEIVEENGKLYFVIDGVKQTGGLYELDGEYYYALSDGSLVRNSSVWVASNDYIPANNYRFDANGKLVKTGFVNASNGYTYYYNDLVLAKGLTKIGEDYYFFNTSSGMMYCDTTLWVGADNAYGLDAGYYYFDTDGKLYVAPATGVKKVIEENGMLYFTIDGVKQGGGLYELDGDYYYVLSNSTILVASSVYLNASLASEFGGAEGYYGFDSEGKLIKTGFVNASNGYTYYYNDLVKAKGFTKIGDDYYFFNASSGSMYKNISLWVSTNSYGVKAGTYRFGEDGKMVK